MITDKELKQLQKESLELVIKKSGVPKKAIIDTALQEFCVNNIDLLTPKELKKYACVISACEQELETAAEERYRLRKEAKTLVMERSGVSKKNIIEDAMRAFVIEQINQLTPEDWEKYACFLPIYAPKTKITANERKQLKKELEELVLEYSNTSKEYIIKEGMKHFFKNNIDLLTPEEWEKYRIAISGV